mmetsp:Transcript_11107/g.32109  ORF Transcript_11107/g.32109 Transcript_11107/m.32109 type:complete len:206 (-) Transcript_11107:492-1109(-)
MTSANSATTAATAATAAIAATATPSAMCDDLASAIAPAAACACPHTTPGSASPIKAGRLAKTRSTARSTIAVSKWSPSRTCGTTRSTIRSTLTRSTMPSTLICSTIRSTFTCSTTRSARYAGLTAMTARSTMWSAPWAARRVGSHGCCGGSLSARLRRVLPCATALVRLRGMMAPLHDGGAATEAPAEASRREASSFEGGRHLRK